MFFRAFFHREQDPRLLTGERVVELLGLTRKTVLLFLIAMSIDPTVGPEGALAGLEWLGADPAAEAELLKRDLPEGSHAPARDVLLEAQVHGDDDPKPVVASPVDPVARTAKPWTLTAAMGGGNNATAQPAVVAIVSMERKLAEHFGVAAQLRAAYAVDTYDVDRVRSVAAQNAASALLACYRSSTRAVSSS